MIDENHIFQQGNILLKNRNGFDLLKGQAHMSKVKHVEVSECFLYLYSDVIKDFFFFFGQSFSQNSLKVVYHFGLF